MGGWWRLWWWDEQNLPTGLWALETKIPLLLVLVNNLISILKGSLMQYFTEKAFVPLELEHFSLKRIENRLEVTNFLINKVTQLINCAVYCHWRSE